MHGLEWIPSRIAFACYNRGMPIGVGIVIDRLLDYGYVSVCPVCSCLCMGPCAFVGVPDEVHSADQCLSVPGLVRISGGVGGVGGVGVGRAGAPKPLRNTQVKGSAWYMP